MILVREFKCSINVVPESRTDRVNGSFIEVRQSVEALGRRPLILVTQASRDGQAVSGAPLILNVSAERVQPHRRVHLYG